MSETKEVKFQRKKKTSTKTKKLSKSAIILIIAGVIILIPCLVFVGILGISALQTGTPREGSRFKDDLVVEISENDVKELETSLNSIAYIETVEAKVSEGQLKVYIDTKDSIDDAAFDKVVSDAYNKVISRFPISTYFKQTDSARMYDLQINVYTSIEDKEGRKYKLLHKNSAEDNFMIDDLATPKDKKLVDELEGKVSSDEVTDDVDIEDIEKVEEE